MINPNWIYAAIVIFMIGTVAYVWAVLQGKARPNRVTWGVVALAPMISFAAMLSKDVSFRDALYVFLSGFSPLLIFLSAFVAKHPAWEIKRFDLVCGGLALLGLVLWEISGEGNVAIVCSIVSDALATFPTINKAFTHPDSEKPYEYIAACIAGLISLAIITQYDFEHLAFTIYMVLVTALLATLVATKLGPKLLRRAE